MPRSRLTAPWPARALLVGAGRPDPGASSAVSRLRAGRKLCSALGSRRGAKNRNGDAGRIGLFGSSSGGHVAELLALRPDDARYHAIPLDEAPGLKASMDYVMTRSPISNTFARFQTAQAGKVDSMIKSNQTFFVPWEAVHEANPQEILDRREKVALKPFLIMQGALDSNMPARFPDQIRSKLSGGGRFLRLHDFRRVRA